MSRAVAIKLCALDWPIRIGCESCVRRRAPVARRTERVGVALTVVVAYLAGRQVEPTAPVGATYQRDITVAVHALLRIHRSALASCLHARMAQVATLE